MRVYQARGYIFESVVWKLLSKFGYIDVTSGNIKGRGAEHQIDAYGLLSIPTAFIYQIRLICECKYYKSKIQLHNIRNFVGVLKDISENYFILSHQNPDIMERYNDVGCFFSASQYTIDAQEYAWAHNIFLVSFYNNPFLESLLDKISLYTKHYNYLFKNATKKSVVNGFWKFIENTEVLNQDTEKPSMAMGILDGKYPVALVGKENWLNDLDIIDSFYNETIEATKTYRVEYETETAFHLNAKNQKIVLTIPNIIARRVINCINNADCGAEIFTIDIPYIKEYREMKIRRFIKIKVYMSHYEKESYLKKLNANIWDNYYDK